MCPGFEFQDLLMACFASLLWELPNCRLPVSHFGEVGLSSLFDGFAIVGEIIVDLNKNTFPFTEFFSVVWINQGEDVMLAGLAHLSNFHKLKCSACRELDQVDYLLIGHSYKDRPVSKSFVILD